MSSMVNAITYDTSHADKKDQIISSLDLPFVISFARFKDAEVEVQNVFTKLQTIFLCYG